MNPKKAKVISSSANRILVEGLTKEEIYKDILEVEQFGGYSEAVKKCSKMIDEAEATGDKDWRDFLRCVLDRITAIKDTNNELPPLDEE